MLHDLKISNPFFQQVIDGNKSFEIRYNRDRGFQKGDLVNLIEVDKSFICTNYTGRVQLVEITYVSNFNQPVDQVVFSFKLIGEVIK